MKKLLLVGLFAFGFVAAILAFGQAAYGQEVMDTITNAKATIAEDQQGSSLVPWIVGVVLTAGVVFVSFKNAQRSHLD